MDKNISFGKRPKNPLHRRVWKDMLRDWKRYLMICLMLIVTIGFVSGMYVANNSMLNTLDNNVVKMKREDGHFTLSKKADEATVKAVETGKMADVPSVYRERAYDEASDKVEKAVVNQASMTGESVPVHKSAGAYVYAGTVVEDGECTIIVENTAGGGRYDRIVKMIEESEKMKSAAEDKASHLADKLVPWSLGGTLLTWLLTRNVTKALSILMVDFSCALKLAMPISVLSAMRDCSRAGITVKGGRFMEAIAEADTIVFDKTGTLTHSAPKVAKVITFDGRDEDEMLRLAACLEEHYPHSIANAVVAEAAKKGLIHEEFHSKVEYVVAHGISSMVEGERVLIGSHHFIIEDEKCAEPDDRRYHELPAEYSHLYLAIGGEVAAVICIEDPHLTTLFFLLILR